MNSLKKSERDFWVVCRTDQKALLATALFRLLGDKRALSITTIFSYRDLVYVHVPRATATHD